ncbi:hypothetical protein EDC01DRAFT_636482 [Geopyxis carbonaria]|nr:hypothetical protein EDC01DRAFT_636482 [Geopyxis carbonaria]
MTSCLPVVDIPLHQLPTEHSSSSHHQIPPPDTPTRQFPQKTSRATLQENHNIDLPSIALDTHQICMVTMAVYAGNYPLPHYTAGHFQFADYGDNQPVILRLVYTVALHHQHNIVEMQRRDDSGLQHSWQQTEVLTVYIAKTSVS